MKKTIALISASLLSLGVAHAASYTLTSGSGAGGTGFGNSAGVAFQNSTNASFAGPGIVGFGIFTISDSAISEASSASTLVSSFVGFGGTPTTPFTSAGLTANRGTFSRNSAQTVAGSNFAGNFMYVFAGNGTTFANSTEFVVLKTGFTFNAADDSVPTPITNTISASNVTLLFGSTIANLATAGTDTSVTPGFLTAAPIPEPSVALLGALGVFGLIRRRR